jgi:hypothetical protein
MVYAHIIIYVKGIFAMDSDPTVRKIIPMPKSLADAVSEYRHEHRIASEAEAYRRLLRQALEAGKPDRPR